MFEDVLPEGLQSSITKHLETKSPALYHLDVAALLGQTVDPEQLIEQTSIHQFVDKVLQQGKNSTISVFDGSNKKLAAVVSTAKLPDDISGQDAGEIGGKIYLIRQNIPTKVLFEGSIHIAHITIVHSSAVVALKVYSVAVMNARNNSSVDIPEKDYANKAFAILLKKCPNVVFHSAVNNSNAVMRDYMGKLLSDAENLPVKHKFLFSGWFKIADGWTYLHGNMENVKSDRKLPHIVDVNSSFSTFFKLGCNFLNPGQEAANLMIFLHSHLGYLARVLKEANFPAHYLLFLKGKTNAGKTSLLSELSGSIMYEKPPMARLEDTRSYLEGIIADMQDSLLLVDDAHPSPTLQGEKDIKANIEVVVRAYGDSQTRGKRGFDRVSLEKTDICGAVWMTGEFLHLAAQSSTLRVLQVELRENGVNKETLSILQQNKYIAKNYYSGYIQYLACNFDKLVQCFSSSLSKKRKAWREALGSDIGRTVDIAVSLDFIAGTVCGYADYAGQNITDWYNDADKFIRDFLTEKVVEDQKSDPIIVFKDIIRALYDAGELKIAPDKNTFRNDLSFVGYAENGLFIVINAALEKSIKAKCIEKGISYMQPSLVSLHEAGFIADKKATRFSLNRADNSRPTMLKIYINKIL
ncbi:hypothetical protein [Pectinatus frisingensis]|uniref:hypothetical protein n=1 Tax=Pectinatus frisingensis TaxID=865 RepID=UPI0018C7BC4B|nr:hypothetical protein [Pectinatus frisingensis]